MYWTQKDEPASRTVLNPFRQMMESFRSARHQTAVDLCSWCHWANSAVSTKENGVPSRAKSMSKLEVSMNSRNSIPRSLSSHGLRLHAVPSSLTTAPPPVFTLSKAQTEDGHAMMEADTFLSFRHLSQRERWCICHECRRHE